MFISHAAKSIAWAVGFVLISIAVKLAAWMALAFLGERIERSIFAGIVALIFVMGLTRIAAKRFELGTEKNWILLQGNSRDLKQAAVGLVIGFFLFAVTYILVRLTGGVTHGRILVQNGSIPIFLLTTLISTIVNAAWEEFTFRGFPFVYCVRSFGPHRIALGLGLLFGLAHLTNPNWTVAAIASTSLAGWLLSYSMLASRSLATVIGMHIGWNYLQYALMSKRIWLYDLHPNDWLSGGQYGLEATVVGISVTACAVIVSWVLFRRLQK